MGAGLRQKTPRGIEYSFKNCRRSTGAPDLIVFLDCLKHDPYVIRIHQRRKGDHQYPPTLLGGSMSFRVEFDSENPS